MLIAAACVLLSAEAELRIYQRTRGSFKRGPSRVSRTNLDKFGKKTEVLGRRSGNLRFDSTCTRCNPSKTSMKLSETLS